MPSSKSTNNPHSAAAGAYGTQAQKHTPDQRELEGRILLKAARMMSELQKSWDQATPAEIDEILAYNRKLWLMFYDTALENAEGGRPNDLRSNIINLANFIFKREVEIRAKPKKQDFDILISINQEIAAGLMTRPKQEENQEKP